MGEAAWADQYRPIMSVELRKRQLGLSEEVKEIAWKAQHRLCTRYRRLLTKGKAKPQVITAVGRELLGFVWSIGVQVEKEQTSRRRTAWGSTDERTQLRNRGTGGRFLGAEQVVVEGLRNGGPSFTLCGRAEALIHVDSPRQLPTDHDHDGGPLPARSANIRVINRRQSRLDRRLLCARGDPVRKALTRSSHIRVGGR